MFKAQHQRHISETCSHLLMTLSSFHTEGLNVLQSGHVHGQLWTPRTCRESVYATLCSIAHVHLQDQEWYKLVCIVTTNLRYMDVDTEHMNLL